MGIRGTLNTMSVSDLLQFLASGRKTGTLKLGLGDIVKHIYLEDGIIVGSSSNDPKEYLGQVLLHYGKIEEAHFEFFDREPPPKELIRIRVEVTSVIMDGIYRIDEWARYRTVIPSARTFFELNPGWTQSLGNANPESRQVLYLVEKHMTAAEICYNMHTSLFHACALLFDLVDTGVIKVAGEAPAPVEVPTDLSALNLPKTVPELLKLARSEIKENNAENALAIIHSALEQEAKNPEAQRLREEAEKKYVAQIYAGGLSPRAMPRILVTPEQLEHERLGPQEGFVLSRINGESDIESILSVCPFREADSLRMIKKLLDGGIIGIK